MDAIRAVWHSRGYLPHFDGGEIPQMVTFRLAGSLPAHLLESWRDELEHLPGNRRATEEQRRVEAYLDRGVGPRWLADPAIADLVDTALRQFDDDRYRLHAWVVMPNHVHLLLTPMQGFTIGELVASWKKYSARRANERLNRGGPFWQREYFDRYIRSERHYVFAVHYIEHNPVTAGLCAEARDWRWGSAARREE